MLKYGEIAKHNFLDPSWFLKFHEVGISMEDASWWIIEDPETKELYVIGEDEYWIPENKIPTYTLPDIIYKLPNTGPLEFRKDAPFYIWNYGKIDCIAENPLEAAANLLIWFAENKLGYVKNIKGKYKIEDHIL